VEEEHENESAHRSFFIVILLVLVHGLAGCQQKWTAEKSGQKIDQAAEEAGKKMGEAKESLGKKAERTGEYMEDTAITAKIKAPFIFARFLHHKSLGKPMLAQRDLYAFGCRDLSGG